MSKFLTLLLALFITVNGTGCSNNKSASDPPNTNERQPVSSDSGQPADSSAIDNGVTINSEEVKSVKLKITICENHAIAVLDDSKTARDFMSLLPLKLAMTDYNGTEKVADLPRKLNLDGAPAGFDPSVGDITTYTPWGNLAVFYNDFGYVNGLVPLARIESGIEYFAEQSGKFKITIDFEN